MTPPPAACAGVFLGPRPLLELLDFTTQFFIQLGEADLILTCVPGKTIVERMFDTT
jgi:hypothetical protein